MLEDGLRNLPMATTGYLQRIRATQHYQDIIAAGELYKVIVRAVQAAETRLLTTCLSRPFVFVQEDWLDCRLLAFVKDLTLHGFYSAEWSEPELIDGFVTINSGNTITPYCSRDHRTLIGLVRKVQIMPRPNCRRFLFIEVCTVHRPVAAFLYSQT
jgi:hypothetical protein